MSTPDVLVLDAEAFRKLQEMVRFGDANPRTLADAKRGVVPGTYNAIVLGAYKVVYSLDAWPDLRAKHLSVSRVGGVPGRNVMTALAVACGFDLARTVMGTTPGDPPEVIHALQEVSNVDA